MNLDRINKSAYKFFYFSAKANAYLFEIGGIAVLVKGIIDHDISNLALGSFWYIGGREVNHQLAKADSLNKKINESESNLEILASH